ncbi:MAG: ribonuclease HII [Bacteroidia bacterium]|nr:ribonuclease HII [Bacteroidia bacterium]MDW8301258.1 ribonuclease HII [Bacteroidia bacterium]
MLKKCYKENVIEAGVDEVGRGCLAGIVVAAAVILPTNVEIPNLKDSKQLSPAMRKELSTYIIHQAIAYAIGVASVEEIDRLNILQATYLAMHRAIEQLKPLPMHLLVDGNQFKPYPGITHTCIVKGDAQYQSIAAASVLAKNYRDAYMHELSKLYPEYQWDKNVGYPTPQHIQAISKYGYTVHHRKSFVVKALQPKLFSPSEKDTLL